MKRVLVGMDGSFRDNFVLREASEFAQALKGQLVLMRAVFLPEDFPLEAYSLPKAELLSLLAVRARQELQTLGDTLPTELNGGLRVETGVPWQAICRVAKAENVDYIFLGTHGNDAADRLLGTTVSKVANNADRPVVIFRAIPFVPKPSLSEETKETYESF
jgi:nucleotide-binding universal stress UspA family protein